ncbi:MAG: hypothetical protein U5N56_13470 [Candidatus Marinimicrobia bacterium]|nr:hypothetical protein [Candidatus Neomarinimicrobiota bacterium]
MPEMVLFARRKPLLFFACPKKSKQKKDRRFSSLAKNPLRFAKMQKGLALLNRCIFLRSHYRIFFTRRRDAAREDLLQINLPLTQRSRKNAENKK